MSPSVHFGSFVVAGPNEFHQSLKSFKSEFKSLIPGEKRIQIKGGNMYVKDTGAFTDCYLLGALKKSLPQQLQSRKFNTLHTDSLAVGGILQAFFQQDKEILNLMNHVAQKTEQQMGTNLQETFDKLV